MPSTVEETALPERTSIVDKPADPSVDNNMNEDIDPENEVQGMKLVLIHTAICLCTFLVGLVSFSSAAQQFSLHGLCWAWVYGHLVNGVLGLQPDRHSCSCHHS